MTSRKRFAVVLLVCASIVGTTTLSLMIYVAGFYSIKWRLDVVVMKLKGDVAELGWWELLTMLR